jgi:hypothetical protein
VLKERVSEISDGEKIQIGEQLDWRASPERTGGNRSSKGQSSCISLWEMPEAEAVVNIDQKGN